MFAAFHVRISSREQSSIAEAAAAAGLIGVRQCRGNPVAIRGQQIRVTLSDMAFPLFVELDIAVQIGTSKDSDRVP
ncbi:MAG: hypothetical protein ACREE1_07480, partial [Stellaceae bacterium]